MRILMDLHIQKSYFQLLVSAYVCLLSAKVYNKLQKKFQIVTLHLYHMQIVLETFLEDWTKTLCIGAHKRVLMHYGLWRQFLVSAFQCAQTALNIMKLTDRFSMLKNMQPLEYVLNNSPNLSTGHTKIIRMHVWLRLTVVKDVRMLLYATF